MIKYDEQGVCRCSCSCLAFGTMVQAGNGTFKGIETYAVGDQVMASGTSFNWSPKPVVFSQGTTGASLQKFTVVVLYKDTAIAVTSDHLFLTRDKTLKRADRLAPGDILVSPLGEPVPINSVHNRGLLFRFSPYCHLKRATRFAARGPSDQYQRCR